MLSKLGQVGNTVGKEGGKGLGISQAKAAIERSGGILKLRRRSTESADNIGTRVDIFLPPAAEPSWACAQLDVSRVQTLVILDDDPSVHGAWRLRFQNLKMVQLVCLSRSAELIDWLDQSREEAYFLLLDHDLRHEELTGLDLMERLRIAKSSCLVTSRWDCAKIQDRLEKLGGKMFPKVLIPYLPIRTDLESM